MRGVEPATSGSTSGENPGHLIILLGRHNAPFVGLLRSPPTAGNASP